MLKLSKRQIKKELGQLYPAPSPEGKGEFLNNFIAPRASLPETIAAQIGYIHKSAWILSVLIVAAALFHGNYLQQEEKYGILWSLSAAMPLLAVLTVAETFRSSTYGMAELEMASKHSLPQVMLVRMGAMAAGNLFLMVLGLPFLVQKSGLGLLHGAVYLLAPWLCACVLGLWVEKYARGREGVWYCGICGCFLFLFGFIRKEFLESLYSSGKFYLWAFIILVPACLLARQLWQIYHGVEEWKCNLYVI